MKKPVYILGINESHVATAALLKDGEIVACASEERFTRVKGQWGYPKLAVEYCLKEAGITSLDLNEVYMGFESASMFILGSRESIFISKVIVSISPYLRSLLLFLVGIFPFTYNIYDFMFNTFYNFFLTITFEYPHRRLTAKALGIDRNKIKKMDHHLAHAMAAYYSGPKNKNNKQSLVITNDGMGDKVCSRIYKVKNYIWEEIASTPNAYSLGWLYLFVTEYLGMKPNEHEYKVMGLAPYAQKDFSKEICDIFKKLMWIEGLRIKSKVPVLGYSSFIKKKLFKKRFDSIAGGVQMFTEESLRTLIKNSISKTKINNLVLGGGVFMNVKANMEIVKLKEVKKIFIMPSCGDESTAIGAAYYGYMQFCKKEKRSFMPKPLINLYLGPKYSEEELTNNIKEFSSLRKNIKVRLLKNPAKEIAILLQKGEVIARFFDRMEFGARALGNRSILANPSNPKVIRLINEQIKGRDFWMPFAPVILNKRSSDYLISAKDVSSPFMMITFDTTKKAQKDLIAALHPYDFTARPQILSKESNPQYYEIIEEFEKLTGIGGLLNTSFNIHGEPIVCSPADALNTFQKSGLLYMQLGNFLLEKLV